MEGSLSSEFRKEPRLRSRTPRSNGTTPTESRTQTKVNPDSWVLQRALVNRAGNKEIMLALLYDYRTNLGSLRKVAGILP